MRSDSPIVDEVRLRREEISRRFGDDVERYGAHILELQVGYKDRLVSQVTVVPARAKATEEGKPKGV